MMKKTGKKLLFCLAAVYIILAFFVATAESTDEFFILTQPQNVSACPGDEVTFSVSAPGAQSYCWQVCANGEWMNTYLTGYNTSTLHVTVFKIRFTFQWRCMLTDSYGNVIYTNEVGIIQTVSEASEEEEQDTNSGSTNFSSLQSAQITPKTAQNNKRIIYDVPEYVQHNDPICWAVSQMMVQNFQRGTVMTDQEAYDTAIQLSIDTYGDVVAGYPTDAYYNTDFLTAADVTLNSLYGMLLENGPLYGIYSSSSEGHCIVVTGVDVANNQVYTNNPWGPDYCGSQTLSNFVNGFIGSGKNYGLNIVDHSAAANIIWYVENSVLHIGGEGGIMDFSATSPAPWYYDDGILSVQIDEGVTAVGRYAFCNLNITEASLPETLEAIGDNAFDGCNDLLEIEIPANVSVIGENIFRNCRNLSTAALSAACITDIPYGAFDSCWSLQSIEIPYGVVSIGDYAFRDTALRSVSLPVTVRKIGKGTFSGCSVADIYFSGTLEEAYQINIYENCVELSETKWHCTDGEAIGIGSRSGFREGSIMWTVEDSKMFVWGTGAMSNYSEYDLPPWYDYRNSVCELVIENDIAAIGTNAFMDFASLHVVRLDSALVSVGESAFSGCDSIFGVYFMCTQSAADCIQIYDGNDSLSESNWYFAYPDPSMTRIVIPSSVNDIESEAFSGLNVQVLYIPSSVESIGSCAFSGCEQLRILFFEGEPEMISNDALSGCPYAVISCEEGCSVYTWALENGYPVIERR